MTFEAVLFDWRGTLVTSPGSLWAVQRALGQVGRPAGPAEAQVVLDAVLAANGKDNKLDSPGMDTDATLHRSISMEVFQDAGLDQILSEALYAVDADPAYNLFAEDALETVRELRDRGLAVAVISDIHFNIRPHFEAAGFNGLIDAFVLSFETGLQKPDPAIFTNALGAVGISADRALMVGDRSRPDGAAVESGIATLLLPPLTSPQEQRLHRVLALCVG